MAGLFPPEHRTAPDHFFENIFIADGCANHANAETGECPFETEIRHDSGDYRVSGKVVVLL